MKTPRLLSFKWLKCLYCHGVIKLDLTNKPWHVSASKPLSGNLLTDYWMLDAFVSTFFTSLKESFYRHLSYTPSKVLRDILFMKSLRFKKPWLKLQLQYLAQRTGGECPYVDADALCLMEGPNNWIMKNESVCDRLMSSWWQSYVKEVRRLCV